eukprot:s853_g8.t1
MKAAWNEQKMSNIDYSRADEQTQDEFMNFYNGLLAERDYMKRVKQSEDPLLAGAAMRRTVDFFELMALQYMYVDSEDVDRVKNADTTNPDMPFVEDNLRRIFIVGNIKAAKMRAVTMYLVQKTSYLMTQGLACAFSNMQKNEKGRDLIGFIKHLLVHAQHAYLSSISDHNQFMHQVGSFCRSDRHLGGGAAPWLLDALKSQVRKNLLGVDNSHPEFMTGIEEGLESLGGQSIRQSLPVRIRAIVDDIKKKGILSGRDPDLQNLLGMTVVAFAFFAPQFSNAVVMRCMSGLLGSLNSTFYRHDYEESVLQELTKVFISGDLGERVKALQKREDELKEEYDDLCQAVEKLQRLRLC